MKKTGSYLSNIFLTFLLLFLLMCCNSKNKTQTSAKPNCIEMKIVDFKKTACHVGASIKQFNFQNKTVYAFLPGNCGADMTTEVIDENCKTLGFLGGIMGNTQINGEKFPINQSTKIIWESN